MRSPLVIGVEKRDQTTLGGDVQAGIARAAWPLVGLANHPTLQAGRKLYACQFTVCCDWRRIVDHDQFGNLTFGSVENPFLRHHRAYRLGQDTALALEKRDDDVDSHEVSLGRVPPAWYRKPGRHA